MKKRRSGLKIMSSLIVMLGSLSYIMLLAVFNGTLGFICAMGVTVFASLGVAKFLGEAISLSYSWIIGLTILSGLLRGGLRYIEQYSNHFIAFKLLAKLRDKIFSALRVLAPVKLESKQKGSIIAMITSDIETLEVFYAHTISPICIAIMVSLVVLIYVGVLSTPYFALIALFFYIVIGVIIPLVSSKLLNNSGVRYRAIFASFNAYFLDSIKGVKDIVLNNASKTRRDEVNKKSDELLVETKNMKHKGGFIAAMTEASVSIAIVVTLLLGIIMVKNDVISIGKMIIGVVAIFGSFGPVIALASLPQNLTQTFASGDRVLDLLNEKPVVSEIKGKNDFNYEALNVSNLNFGYDDSLVLKDISLNAKKGEIIGIVGESGCGKSTLMKLLLRFWKKSSGNILYNDIDIEDINTDSLLKNVTMVSQSTYLFDDTIKENLKIAKADAKDEEIIEAAKRANIHDYIMTLEKGYDTYVGERGVKLSGGQKQRISIARAFLKNPPILILDEATSALDTISEMMIQDALDKLSIGRTTIVVAHRLSTVKNADMIMVITKNGIEECGNHEELLNKGGLYKELYQYQFKQNN